MSAAPVLSIRGATVHNLRRLDCELPLHRNIAICGPSGSGKSTFIRDLLFREWQRRIGRTTAEPAAEKISGLPPVLFFENRSQPGRKGNVLSETGGAIYLHFLAAVLGRPVCIHCGGAIEVHRAAHIISAIEAEPQGSTIIVSSPPKAGGDILSIREQALGRGFSRAMLDGKLVRLEEMPSDHLQQFSIAVDLIVKKEHDRSRIAEALRIATELNADELEISINGSSTRYPLRPRCSVCAAFYEPLTVDLFQRAEGACPVCKGRGALAEKECDACEGTGLGAYLRSIELFGARFVDLLQEPLFNLEARWPSVLPNDAAVARAGGEIQRRVSMLTRLGLGYLRLKRRIATLSAGELQRVKLARVLTEEIGGALYALDDPTAGLHPQDGKILQEEIQRIVSEGNTAVSTTHDFALIGSAEEILEFGPGAGANGGRIVFQGPLARLKDSGTLTARALNNLSDSPAETVSISRSEIGSLGLHLQGLNNIEALDVKIPLGKIVCICGVSGSGKSTLLFQGLAPLAKRAVRERTNSVQEPFGALAIEGGLLRVEDFQSVPRLRHRRGNVAGLLEVVPHLRELYAALEISRIRGLEPKKFRFSGETADISFKGLQFGQILSLSIQRASEHFARIPRVAGILRPAIELGLGYLILGQEVRHLSQGEEQRLKLSKIFRRRAVSHGQLFLLDEPSRGLHPAEQAGLLQMLGRIVDAGNTIVLADHSPIILRGADHIIEMGPGAGANGGRKTAEGSLQVLKDSPRFSLRNIL